MSPCDAKASVPYLEVHFEDGPEDGVLAHVCEDDACDPRFWRFEEVHGGKRPEAKILFADGLTMFVTPWPGAEQGCLIDEDGDEHRYARCDARVRAIAEDRVPQAPAATGGVPVCSEPASEDRSLQATPTATRDMACVSEEAAAAAGPRPGAEARDRGQRAPAAAGGRPSALEPRPDEPAPFGGTSSARRRREAEDAEDWHAEKRPRRGAPASRDEATRAVPRGTRGGMASRSQTGTRKPPRSQPTTASGVVPPGSKVETVEEPTAPLPEPVASRPASPPPPPASGAAATESEAPAAAGSPAAPASPDVEVAAESWAARAPEFKAGAVEAASPGAVVFMLERAKTARSLCRTCGKPIDKGQARCGTKAHVSGRSVMIWAHAPCFLEKVTVEYVAARRGKCRGSGEAFAPGDVRVSLGIGGHKTWWSPLQAARWTVPVAAAVVEEGAVPLQLEAAMEALDAEHRPHLLQLLRSGLVPPEIIRFRKASAAGAKRARGAASGTRAPRAAGRGRGASKAAGADSGAAHGAEGGTAVASSATLCGDIGGVAPTFLARPGLPAEVMEESDSDVEVERVPDVFEAGRVPMGIAAVTGIAAVSGMTAVASTPTITATTGNATPVLAAVATAVAGGGAVAAPAALVLDEDDDADGFEIVRTA